MRIFNILICDDSKVQRQITKQTILRYLSQYQISIYESADGEEALKILKKRKIDFDLVFLDLEMPKITGIEILNLLKGKPHDFLNLSFNQIIVLSTDPKKIPHSISEQLLDQIKKPIVPLKFAEQVKEIFAKYGGDKVVRKEIEVKLAFIYDTILDLSNKAEDTEKDFGPEEIRREVLGKLLINDDFLSKLTS